MVPVFNDHSLLPLAEGEYSARARLSVLVAVLAEAPGRGLAPGLRVAESFHDSAVAVDYTIGRWLTDRLAERDEKNYLLQVALTTPLMSDAPSAIIETGNRFEIRYTTFPSSTFLAAHLLDVPLVSLNHDCWSDAFINATLACLEDSGEISEQEIDLINISTVEHFDTHSGWITSRRIREVSSMRHLWEQRSHYFPNIEFCPTVEAQLLAIGKNHPAFDLTLAILFDMQACSARFGPRFDSGAFQRRCRASSASTLAYFESDYTFLRETGPRILCGWHFALPNGWRLYFGVSEGTLVIGHIGSHLPTRMF